MYAHFSFRHYGPGRGATLKVSFARGCRRRLGDRRDRWRDLRSPGQHWRCSITPDLLEMSVADSWLMGPRGASIPEVASGTRV